jgi:hypothetical protein
VRWRVPQLRMAAITGTKTRPLCVRQYSTLGGTLPDQSGRGKRLQFAADNAWRNFGAAIGAWQPAGTDFAIMQRAMPKIPDRDPQPAFLLASLISAAQCSIWDAAMVLFG